MFWLSGGRQRDPAVDAWLNAQVPDLGAIAAAWFARMRACGDDVRELIHDGCPVACVEDAAFGYVNVFRAHVNVGFFSGADLEDPNGLLQGSGRRMRHVKVRPGEQLDEEALSALIVAAYADTKARLDVGANRPSDSSARAQAHADAVFGAKGQRGGHLDRSAG